MRMVAPHQACCRACLRLRPGFLRPAILSATGRRILMSGKPALSQLQQRQLSRGISNSSRLSTAAGTPTAEGSNSKNSTPPPKSSSPPHSRRRGIIATALVIGATGWAWLFFDTGSAKGEAYPTRFTPFTVTGREQISPTAFILTVRNDSQPGETSITPASVRAAWQHGLWSVEIKQPQLQIARHYTPLPPLTDSDSPASSTLGGNTASSGDGDELRFLVRKMDTGEMSNYLSRRQVGDQIWLRGPHLGFDVARRLGSAKKVVFLAGGTGVAPALQVAHKLLENQATQGVAQNEKELPTVSILWANRHGVDALGRQATSHSSSSSSSNSSWTSWLWGSSKSSSISINNNTTSLPPATLPSLAQEILEMKQKYGPRFQIEYFIDDEKAFINQDTITKSIANITPSSSSPIRTSSTVTEDSSRCIWHSPSLLERLTGDNDVDRAKDPAISACACSTPQKTGKDLLFVSGPDGFMRAYAGAKWWHGGLEMQGPVRGVIEGMMRNGNGTSALKKDDWLVLKL